MTRYSEPDCDISSYDSSIWGPSGNRTINGRLTYGGGYRGGPEPTEKHGEGWDTSSKRGRDGRSIKERDLNTPPYAIHHGAGRLSDHALATNATHAGGLVEFDTHNLWGFMEERATHIALEAVHPGKRPFLISRSTFPGAGRWTGHWLGDNFSKWSYMYMSIQGVLQFQVFQVPFTGADTCGFNGNTDEELCSRWMQLSAFLPFYRNHNVLGAIPQEPYNWDSVADASRQAIYMRYSLLPYWVCVVSLRMATHKLMLLRATSTLSLPTPHSLALLRSARCSGSSPTSPNCSASTGSSCSVPTCSSRPCSCRTFRP